MSVVRGTDLEMFFSTVEEATYGVAVVDADFQTPKGRKFMAMGSMPTVDKSMRPYRPCGGEFAVGMETLREDVVASFGGAFPPDFIGLLDSYAFGGDAAYTVAGAGDPYTHTDKLIVPPDLVPDSFSFIAGYAGETTLWKFKGGQINSYGCAASFQGGEGDFNFNAEVWTDGSRTAVTGYTRAVCDNTAKPYNIKDATINFGPYGGAADANLDIVGIAFQLENNLRVSPKRTGMYVARGREIGVRNVVADLEVTGKAGDAVDLRYMNGTEVFLTMSVTNPTTNRVLTRNILRGTIAANGIGYPDGLQSHVMRIVAYKDSADATNSTPFNGTIQTGTATYRAA